MKCSKNKSFFLFISLSEVIMLRAVYNILTKKFTCTLVKPITKQAAKELEYFKFYDHLKTIGL